MRRLCPDVSGHHGKVVESCRFTIDEDAFALPAVFNEQPGIIQKNGDAFARNAHVVERQVITVFLAPSNEEWKGGDGTTCLARSRKMTSRYALLGAIDSDIGRVRGQPRRMHKIVTVTNNELVTNGDGSD